MLKLREDRMLMPDEAAVHREVMKTALTVLCMARRSWLGVIGWNAAQLKDFDIAIEGLRGALGIDDEQSGSR